MFSGSDRTSDRQARAVGALAHVARFPQRVLTAVLLAAAALVSLTFGVVDVTQPWDTDDLDVVRNVREAVFVSAGVFLFGAGLLHLATGRLDGDAGRLRFGGGLAVFGLVLPVAIALGGLMHETETARMLSPVLVTLTAVATLALLTTTGHGTEGFWARPGALATLGVGVVVTVVLASLAFIFEWPLDPPVWAHVRLELLVAAGWFAAAMAAHSNTRWLPGVSADVDSLILGALGGVWLLRAMAAYDVEGWGVSPTLLLLAVAVVVASHAMAHFVQAAEAEQQRVEEAERAAQAALDQLAVGREQRQAFRHGARNSLYALRIAAEALAIHGEALDAEGRQRLQQAIRDETAALGSLVEEAMWRGGEDQP